MDKIELEKLIKNNMSQIQIAKFYNLSQTTIRYWINKFCLKTNKKQFAKSPKWSIEELIEAIKQSKTYTNVFKILKLSVNGGNHKTIKKYIKKHNIDISHFNKNFRPSIKRYALGEILVKNSPYVSSVSLKKRLLKDCILLEQCYICGLKNIWNNFKLTLELDHINGEHADNRLENLRILCPNCHSQTETFGTKCPKAIL